jgi:hypothetical protein
MQQHLTLSSSDVAPASRSRLARALQGVAGLGLALLAGLAGAGPMGCGSSSGGATTPFCEGGFVRPVPGKTQGTCEGLCKPSLCANPGNVCVDNYCELQCTSHLDCDEGQDCAPAKEDGTGTAITTCQANGKSSVGTKCPFGTECASLLTCPDGSNCDYTQCGGGTCTLDPVACDGVTGCTAGKCADKSACTVQGCAQSDCKPLTCLTTGSGDADAYCTLLDCQSDANCPGGYWCDTVSDPHQICGQPAPDPKLCGTTKEGCVTLSQNAANGTTYSKGQYCTERKECRLRSQCDPCATDLDCSIVAGRHCSSGNCLYDCKTDSDCDNGFQCTAGECAPRFGSCAGAVGTGKFCDPCRNQDDCAKGYICEELTNGGLRTCLISAGTMDCTVDSDCPKSPSGLYGACLGAAEESSPGDGVYQTCFAPFIAAADGYACWCGNTGTACYTAADCCNKGCKDADELNMTPGTCK